VVDTADLTPMRGNLATRPVERWQFGAFLAITGHPPTRSRYQTDLFDRTRLLARPETEPLTQVLREEASLYARWAGKRVATRQDWRAAPPGRHTWGAIREWAEEVAPGVVGVVGPGTVDADPTPEPWPWPRDERRRDTFQDWEAPKTIGFRTAR